METTEERVSELEDKSEERPSLMNKEKKMKRASVTSGVISTDLM